jgi:hypothetical protein
MYKLFSIGALVAALAVPAVTAGQGVRACHARVQVACPQIFPGRPYGLCGGKIWFATRKPASSRRSRFGSCSIRTTAMRIARSDPRS